jgi:ppGpp synthetase/RelA/SpoT-type nucleotidyltranferase
MKILTSSSEEIFDSYLREASVNSLIRNNPKAKEFSKLQKSSAGKNQLNSAIEDFYSNILPKLQEIEKKFFKLLNKLAKGKGMSGRNRVLAGVKPLKSVKSKVIVRGKPITELGDLVRGALLFEYPEDVEDFVKNFRRKYSSMITDYEVKEKGKDSTFGYFGSHHFDLNIDGLVVELQVMTKKLWSYKDVAHDIYDKYRDVINKGGGPDSFDQSLSKKIFSLGNKPKYRKESIEEVFNDLFEEDFNDWFDSLNLEDLEL